MSIVREINGKLKFPPVPRNEYLQKIAKEPILVGPALAKALAKNPDKHSRSPSGKISCKLPDDYLTQEPYRNHTLPHWRRVSIRESGDRFRLVTLGAGIAFLPGALRVLGVNVPTESLTMAQAVAGGELLEDAYRKLMKKK